MELLETLRTGLAGRYEIERELGRGGMAVVYDALDQRHGRHVAIKVLRPEIAQAVGAERFLREIEIEARLQHPHILPLYDSGHIDGVLFYVMPRIEGESLRALLDREGQLRFEDAYGIADEVADALSYAHSMGVVHRDIKPENILLGGGHAVVTDFGIAAAVTAAGGERLTESGIAIGTPQYMSPEQASADPRVDPRTDLYALGCVLYEMLAGQAPFSGSTAQAILRRHQLEPPPPLDVVRPRTPRPVVDVITTALQKAPADRHRTVAEFREQLSWAARAAAETPVPSRWAGRLRRIPGTLRLALAAGLLLGAAGLALVLRPSAPSWVGGRPASLVVVPFDRPSATASEHRVVQDVAAALTRELEAWETIRVVPQVALAGPMFDMGFRAPILTRLEDAVRLAGAFGVQAVVTVVARLRGDSVEVEVDLFDRRGRPAGRGFRAAGMAGDPSGLVASLAVALLGLDRVVDPRTSPRRRSAHPEAITQEAAGLRALERWRLLEAERHFRAALALDSTYAVAHHRLAQTLYWQAAQEPARLSALGPEVARHSTAALRDATGLPDRDSLHIRAFQAFQSGDYATARALYHHLLARDSADVYAWLMLGSVEYWDPWLMRGPDGAWMPRASLHTAVRSFAEAVRLQPTFDLGYGHLFDVHRLVIRALEARGCPVFEPPTGERIAPWEDVEPRQPEAFCPVPLDSLSWIPFDSLESRARDMDPRGADALFEQSLRLLRRWAAYAPDEPKPWRELTAAVVAQRARLGPAPPARLDSLAADARASLDRALAASRDTLPLDLVRLGVLHLGTNDPARAILLTEAGLAGYAAPGERPRSPPPAFAANVFLAVGRPGRALPLVAAAGMTRFVPDTATGTLVPWGGAEPLVERLRLLGAAQVGGEPVRAAIAEIGRLWSAPRYTPAQQRILRRDAALRAILGLVLVPGATAAWDRGLDWDEPLWRALVAMDTDRAAANTYLDRSLQAPSPLMTDAALAYLQGLVAARVGRHAEALALFRRLDSLPLELDRLDVNWGLRWPAVLRRAESHEALGHWDAARDAYEQFARAWADGDSLVTPLVASARRRAAAIRERG